MIDRAATIEKFGHDPDELKPRSGKRVVAVCEGCGVVRDLKKKDYRDLCIACTRKGKKHTDATRRKMSEAKKGKKRSNETLRKMSEARKGKKHKPHTDATRRKMSESMKGKKRSDEARRRISEAKSNISDETRKRLSAAHQGILYKNWNGYAKKKLYCDKFNTSCKEHNREKYGRECFICGKPEKDNLTKSGKQKRLSVHHIDMNKSQGCDDHQWKLIPVCLRCHVQLHNQIWIARLQYILG